MNKVHFQDLGRVDFKDAWDHQTRLHKALISRKLANRDLSKKGLPLQEVEHHLLFCEHPPVFTLGKSGTEAHLLLSADELRAEGIQYYKINRGGDITYHGPGQLVVYPIFDLDDVFTDVHRYVRYLEEAVIRTLAEYDLVCFRESGYTGVWLKAKDGQKRKICAIGVHLSRWVSMHGLALNVSSNLDHFRHIVPCGIAEPDRDVTSMEAETGQIIGMEGVKEKLQAHFARLFEFEYAEA